MALVGRTTKETKMPSGKAVLSLMLFHSTLLTGCLAVADDVCEQAADRIYECLGVDAEFGPQCDRERAAGIASSDCNELTEEAAKADGGLDDFLCRLGFSSYCGSEPELPACAKPDAPGRLHGRVYDYETDEGLANLTVRVESQSSSVIRPEDTYVQILYTKGDGAFDTIVGCQNNLVTVTLGVHALYQREHVVASETYVDVPLVPASDP
jgi:hypothetical protein